MSDKNPYADITNEEFDEELERQVGRMSAGTILAVPGVYEALKEELNNSVLEALRPGADAAAEKAE